LENITLPLSVKGQAIDKNQLNDLIELFQMGKFVKRYPNEASLGQRQRAALVRALMLNPEYILLDEITSSLDVEQIAVLVSHIRELAKRGIGVLAITHLLNFARETADRVLFMDAGEIIESGTRNVLIAPTQDRVRKFMSVMEYAT
jgi:ABC-type polar amino acid transport system ATPase subunit